MVTYEFQSRAELVRYLRSRAAEHNQRSTQFNVRTHQHSECLARAGAYREIADMLERSNITCDYIIAGAGGMK